MPAPQAASSRETTQTSAVRPAAPACIAPDLGVAVADFLASRLAGEAVMDELIPASGRAASLALITAHDQPLGRPRHRHIEQAAVFVLILLQAPPSGRPRRPARRPPAGPAQTRQAGAPGGALRQPHLQKPRRMGARGRRRGVGENHHRGFEALGAMHRHDPDFIAVDFHVALDDRRGAAQPGRETLQ